MEIPAHCPSWGRALPHGPVGCELPGSVIACDLFCALPSLMTYERPGRNSLYVLVWHHLPTCCAHYRYQARHLRVLCPLRRRPLLAPGLFRALVVPKGPRASKAPSSFSSRWWLILGRFPRRTILPPKKNKNKQRTKPKTPKTTMPDGSTPLPARRLTLPCSCWASPDIYRLWLSRCSRCSTLFLT